MTFSIVARDSDDASLAVGVQSAWFAVGHICPWVNAGVGVVATQAFAEPMYGPRGLTLMRNGLSASRTLEALLEIDDGRAMRQVAMIDAHGDIATHTGSSCLPVSEQVTRSGASCQGNMLAHEGTCEAMMAAYESTGGELVDRVLAAIDAAQSAGGDMRGRQSAALLVVSGTSRRNLYTDRVFDVRIDDHPDPISELRRVVTVQRAYRVLDIAEQHMVEARYDVAAEMMREAGRMLPSDVNVIMFGVAAHLALGDRETARRFAERAAGLDVDWNVIATRLAASPALLPDGVDRTAFVELLAG